MARILYFSRDYTPHDHRFLAALSQTDHRVFYLRLEKRGHVLESRPLPPEIESIPWAGGTEPARLADGLKLYNSLKRVIDRVKPDLIQAGPLQSAAFLVALSGFQPLVSVSWGYDLLQDARRNRLYGWITRYVLKHSTVMVGDCETIRQTAKDFGMPGERIVTFPWGVDLERFKPQAEAHKTRRDGSFTLLSTRGWEDIYGIDLIAKAFVHLASEFPQLHLVMLANGSRAAFLHKTFENAGVAERVSMPGQVSQQDLPRYYHMADLYISASHSDGTSISLLEALACGCPVILSDIPGNREWVTPGEQGWLFPDGDALALAGRIRQAILDRDRLSQMREAARQLAESRADWRSNFKELLRAYQIALPPAGFRKQGGPSYA
jgi:glycosyltransferase involved in cell wall biosynthesis